MEKKFISHLGQTINIIVVHISYCKQIIKQDECTKEACLSWIYLSSAVRL